MKALAIFLLGLSLGGCGSTNPYNANPWHSNLAEQLPAGVAGMTVICDRPVVGSIPFDQLTKFGGAVYCQAGQIFAAYERIATWMPIAPGTYSPSQTGLTCTFTVDASCNVTTQW